MEHIKSVIEDYLHVPDTDYAIMITGDWGCGKTYYIHNTLCEYIKTNKCHSDNPQADGSLNYLPVELSLYGVSEVDEIFERVLLGTRQLFNEKVANGIKCLADGVAEFFGVDKSLKNCAKLFEPSKNVVLIFDDLERIDDKKIDIKEVLGVINMYVEKKGVKTIIVCNEEKSNDDLSEFKEKTVRYSVKFNRPFAESFDDIVSSVSDNNYVDFLKSEKEILCRLFDCGTCKNLRTLKFIIDAFEKLYRKVRDMDYASEILHDLLVSMTIYSIEYKNGVSEENLKLIENIRFYFGMKAASSSRNDLPEEETYFDEVGEKYEAVSHEYNYYPVLNHYICDGCLDEIGFDDLSNKLSDEFRKLANTAEGSLYKKLTDWRLIDDDQFDAIIEELYQSVAEGKYSIEQLVDIYAQLLRFEEYEIEDYVVDENVEKCFLNAAYKNVQNQDYDPLMNDMYDVSFRYSYVSKKEKLEKFVNAIKKANIEHGKQQMEEQLEVFMDALEHGNARVISDCLDGPKYHFFYESLDPDAVGRLLVKSKADVLETFRGSLFSKFDESSQYFNVSEKELHFLKTIQSMVTDCLNSQKPKKLSSYWLQMLNFKLNLIIDKCESK